MTPNQLAAFDVLREGDSDGGRTLLRITPVGAPPFHAIAVPQDWHSYTGPTWVYIVESPDGFTLIDAGSGLIIEHLTDAFHDIGIDTNSIKRVIITHGHNDHDGGALLLAKTWGVEVWAHVLWDSLRFHNRSNLEGESYPLVQQALDQDTERLAPYGQPFFAPENVARRQRYIDQRREVNVTRLVDDGDQGAGMTFYHTPGHAPDELTIAMDGVLFAGDHILPEITPHPTLKSKFPSEARAAIPAKHADEDELYGLDVYLRSLLMIAAKGDQALVLPAHRLLNRGKLNIITAARAQVIVDHHVERLEQILELLGNTTWSLAEITRQLFAHRSLDGVYLPALSETMAHVELLIRAGDVLRDHEDRFAWSGSQHYLRLAKAGQAF
jgi:glyoxylase-like metal-dependent hydrolase (beta-lactamase superfamily II)